MAWSCIKCSFKLMLLLLIAETGITFLAKAMFSDDPETTQYVMNQELPNGDQARCLARNRCYLQTLQCPKACPNRVHTEESSKPSCFIDCSATCQASCRYRKANCYGYSSMCYNRPLPEHKNRGYMFYFHGLANQDYCLVSDTDLHVNAHFIGTRPQVDNQDVTWVQSLGIVLGRTERHKLNISAMATSSQDRRLELMYDNLRVSLSDGAVWRSTVNTGDGQQHLIEIRSLSGQSSLQVSLSGVMTIRLEAVSVTPDEMNRFQLPKNELFPHLNVQFRFYQLSPKVDGVLGRTYRPGFKNPDSFGIPIPVDQHFEDHHSQYGIERQDFDRNSRSRYLVSSLFSTDCPASRFGGISQRRPYFTIGLSKCSRSSSRGCIFGILCRCLLS